jgi:hypothetical protein
MIDAHALINIRAPFFGTAPALGRSANAMRRQALPPLAEALAGATKRKLHLVDLGCTGTSSNRHGHGCRWLVSLSPA